MIFVTGGLAGRTSEVPGVLGACLATPFLVVALARTAPAWLRGWRWALPVGLALFGLAAGSGMTPAERLLLASLWMLYMLKAVVLLGLPREALPLPGLLVYAALWPGMDPAPFARRGPSDPSGAALFVQGWVTMLAGLSAVGALALWLPPPGVLGWAGLAALLVTVHLGYSDVLTGALRLVGFPVDRLFDAPLASRSLRDFWTHRWNRPFVEMNRLLFMRPLRRGLGARGAVLGAFAISGLLHEFALSYPAGSGYGGPFAYFMLHGWMTSRLPSTRPVLWLGLLGFLPLLFHAGVREELVTPLFVHLHGLLPDVGTVLTLAACGHFLVLAASFQVPSRLGWAEELPRLRPLNRKLLWTYGAFIVFVIVAFGVLTLLLRDEMVRGDRAAVALAGFIASWWTARVVVDALVFEHADWPEGPEFVVGHALLTTLFVALASVYGGLVAWHLT